MQYIVLDMEWNQAWPGSHAAMRYGEKLRGEIIQIGAVRVTDRQIVGDEFQVLIKPKFIRRLNKRVSALTGIKEAQLQEEGIPFPEAMEQFREWCGEDCVFLTWGFDDINMLKENMELHGLEHGWVEHWYNAQMIFNKQTDGGTSQKALKTAMEMVGVEASRPAHDALGDAYHTAIVCTRLDLPRGMAEYGKAMELHENGFHGAELPGCLQRRVFHGFQSKAEALETMEQKENHCPVCEKTMEYGVWKSQQSRRYMTKASCPEHGTFFVRVRLVEEEGGIKASRLIYEGTSPAAQALVKPTEKKEERAKVRKRRRRRKPEA